MKKRFWMTLVVILGLGLVTWVISLSQSVRATPPAQTSQSALSPSQSLIVAYYNGETRLLSDIIPLGNRPSDTTPREGTLITPGVVSDTLYYRAYLQFDTTGIPAASTVLTAHLNLYVDRFEYAGAVPSGEVVQGGVYAVAEAWSAPSGPLWNWADNPAVVVPASSHQAIPFDQRGWYAWDVTPLVQDWVNAGETNYGLLLGMHPDLDTVGRMTAILLGPTAISQTLRPNLSVVYIVPTPTPTATSTDVPLPTETLLPTDTPPPTSTAIVPTAPPPTNPPQPPPTALPQPTTLPTAAPTSLPTVTPTMILLPVSGVAIPGISWIQLALASLGGIILVGLGIHSLRRSSR